MSMTRRPQQETPTASSSSTIGYYLRIVGWLCWAFAAFFFFAIAGSLIRTTVTWTEMSWGLIAIGLVLRHAPEWDR